jgi:Family of unknown function (DUF6600)
MRTFALSALRRLSITAVAMACIATVPLLAQDQNDPPDQAGRLSAVSGQVSVQPMGTDDWGQAYANLSVGPGDRIYTDADGRAEIQIGQTYLRIGPNSDVTLVQSDPGEIGFGMAQGSVHLRSFGLWQNQHFDLSTPNGNINFDQQGDLRVDVFPNQSTVFTDYGGPAYVTAAGDFNQPMDRMQSLELAGVNPVDPQWLQIGGADDLDTWSQQQDTAILRSASYQYVSPEVPGAADLDTYGDWNNDGDYGAVWYPRNVAYDWAPYHNGHWINREPWGWVWVEDEPWGYAPFHYGRWAVIRGRWGWIPGPREVHPVWSPALVVFAGGIQIGGSNASAWIPLGPGEPYRPWYPCGPRYIDRVNITNIRASRVVHVQTTYVNIVNVTNITYVNRDRGIAAMRQDDFANGRGGVVRVDSRQANQIHFVDRPPVNSTRGVFVARPVGRPVAVSGTRPMVINQHGQMIGMRPGSVAQQPPLRTFTPVRPPAGRVVAAPPSTSRFKPGQPVTSGNPQFSPNPQGGQNQTMPVRPVGRPVMPLPGHQDGGAPQGNGAQSPQGPQNQTMPVRPIGQPVMPVRPTTNDDSNPGRDRREFVPVQSGQHNAEVPATTPHDSPKPDNTPPPPAPHDSKPPAHQDFGPQQMNRPHDTDTHGQKPKNKDDKKKEDHKDDHKQDKGRRHD